MIVITVARKPLSEPTVATNVLKWGCGGINVDASRIGLTSECDLTQMQNQHSDPGLFRQGKPPGASVPMYKPSGRWPTNLILGPDVARELGTSRFFRVIQEDDNPVT